MVYYAKSGDFAEQIVSPPRRIAMTGLCRAGNQFAGYTVNNNPYFNPLDKYVEQAEQIKKLYDALLKEKDEKIALLERMLEKK